MTKNRSKKPGRPELYYRGRYTILPMRDSQRSRVYNAEFMTYGDMWHHGSHWHDFPILDLESLVERVANNAQYKARLQDYGRSAKDTKLVVRENRKRKGGFCVPGEYIELGIGAMNIPCFLHELAHFVGYSSVQHHWPFARTYLVMTREMGLLPYDCAYQLLRNYEKACVEHKVIEFRKTDDWPTE